MTNDITGSKMFFVKREKLANIALFINVEEEHRAFGTIPFLRTQIRLAEFRQNIESIESVKIIRRGYFSMYSEGILVRATEAVNTKPPQISAYLR